jgi:hypothetical protein
VWNLAFAALLAGPILASNVLGSLAIFAGGAPTPFVISQEKITAPYFGDEAYVKAINDGYFDLIQLNYGFNAQTAIIILQAIEHSKKYALIAKIPYQDSYGVGYFWLWRKL